MQPYVCTRFAYLETLRKELVKRQAELMQCYDSFFLNQEHVDGTCLHIMHIVETCWVSSGTTKAKEQHDFHF